MFQECGYTSASESPGRREASMTVPDLRHTIGRCVLGIRAAERRRDLERLLWWSAQLTYARARINA